MGWFQDLQNRIWLETQKARRAQSTIGPGAVKPTGPLRVAGRVAAHPLAQGSLDFGVRVMQGEDPKDAVIDAGAGLVASMAAAKVLPKNPWILIPGTFGAYMAGSGTANWINQNLIKPAFAGDPSTAPKTPATTPDIVTQAGLPIPALETGARQPERGGVIPPASTRPVEERHSPVSRTIPASTTKPPQQVAAEANELAQLYARQYRLGSAMAEGGELQRRLYEGGAAEGMPVEKFMSWVEAHPDLAYRLAEKRGLLPEAV